MGLSRRELMQLDIQANSGNTLPVLNSVAAGIHKTGLAAQASSLKMFGYSHVFSQASRVLLGYGTAVGVIAAVTGKMAVDFDRSMGLVRTQTDMTAREFEKIKRAVLDVSVTTGRSTKELAEGLYDIFSGMNVNGSEAILILRQVAKAAVAGNTDVRTATRATIGMLNAFNLRAQDVNRVLDAQFKFVRLGVGTYEQFAQELGAVSGSAVATGQAVETMTAAFAVATAGALPVSEAGTAVARAMDLIARPDNIAAMEQYGISAVNAQGQFRQLDQIMGQFADRLGHLAAPERRRVIADIFGEGDVRAMRFFNIAIPRIDLFNRMIRETAGPQAAGAMEEAFRKMSETTSFSMDVTIQALRAVGIAMGTAFLPAIKDVLNTFRGWVDVFASIPPGIQQTIARVVIFTGALSLLAGVVLRVISNLQMMVSIARLAGINIAVAMRSVFGIVGVLSLLLGVTAELSGANGFGMIAVVVGGLALALGRVLPMVMQFVTGLRIWIAGMGGVRVAMASAAASVVSFATSWQTVAGVGITAIITSVVWAMQKMEQATTEWANSIVEGQYTLQQLKAEMEDTWVFSDWFQRLQSLGGILPNLVDKENLLAETSNKVRQQYEERRGSLDRAGVSLSGYSRGVIGAAEAEGKFKEALQLTEEAQEAHAEGLDVASDAFSRLAEKAYLTADQIERAVTRQLRLVQNYAGNFNRLVAVGLPREFLGMLQGMGLQGMAIVEQLAGMSRKRAMQIARDWMRTARVWENLKVGITVDADTRPAREQINKLMRDVSGARIGVSTVIEDITYVSRGGDRNANAKSRNKTATDELTRSTNYYSDALNDSSSAADDAAASTDKYTDAQEKALDKVRELRDQLREVREAFRAYKEAGGHLDGYTKALVSARIRAQEFEEAVELINNALDNHNEAMSIATGVFQGFTDQHREFAEAVVGMSTEQIDAILNYAKNWQTIAGMGLPAEFLAQLQGLGLGGASTIAELAGATNEEVARMVQAWQALTAESQTSATDVNSAQEELLQQIRKLEREMRQLIRRGLPKELAQQLIGMGMEGAQIVSMLADANDRQFRKIVQTWRESTNTLAGLMNRIDNLGEKVRNLPPSKEINIKADISQANDQLNRWIERIKTTDVGIEVFLHNGEVYGTTGGKKKHTGGYIGGKGEVPALLEAGEYVIRKEAVWDIGRRQLDVWNRYPRKAPVGEALISEFHQGGLAGMPHGQATYDVTPATGALNALVSKLAAFVVYNGPPGGIPGTSTTGLNNASMFALRSTFGTFPWTALLSGYRPGSIVRGTNTPSQHGRGNAIDITSSPYSKLWQVWDWAMANADKLRIDYSVLSAAGRAPIQYSRGGGFSTPSAINTADHRDHQHMDFYGNGGILREPVIGTGQRTGRRYAFAERGPEEVRPVGRSSPVVGEMHFHDARVDARDVVDELSWYDRTSGY